MASNPTARIAVSRRLTPPGTRKVGTISLLRPCRAWLFLRTARSFLPSGSNGWRCRRAGNTLDEGGERWHLDEEWRQRPRSCWWLPRRSPGHGGLWRRCAIWLSTVATTAREATLYSLAERLARRL